MCLLAVERKRNCTHVKEDNLSITNDIFQNLPDLKLKSCQNKNLEKKFKETKILGNPEFGLDFKNFAFFKKLKIETLKSEHSTMNIRDELIVHNKDQTEY